MPYIALNTAQKLSSAEKERVKTEMGRLIAILPTKNEAGLLVDFSDGRTMYRAGAEVPAAFVEVRLFHESPLEAKKQFTRDLSAMLTRELGIKPEHLYLTILELDAWGTGGELKT